MANETMTLISTITVGAGGAASIEFTSIPQTYTDLILKVSARESSTANFAINLNFNGVTTNLSSRFLQGTGSSASSSSTSDITMIDVGNTATANTFSNAEVYVPNYTGSTNKSVSIDSVSENNATLSFQRITAGLWSNTAAITNVSINGALAQYSTASLYGILKGSGGATVS